MDKNLTYAYVADIVKADETPEGLMVYGMAAGPNRDLVGHEADAKWLAKAMPSWYEWGNVREQHTMTAAGVGRELDKADGDKWMLKALIVDAGTIAKVKAGVLKGFSIGIHQAKLLGNKIVDGIIPEVSLVDRPCNPLATISIAKSADGKVFEGVEAHDAMSLLLDDVERALWEADGEASTILKGAGTGTTEKREAALAMLADIIIGEAQAMKTADAGEPYDVSLLVKAVSIVAERADLSEEDDEEHEDDDWEDAETEESEGVEESAEADYPEHEADWQEFLEQAEADLNKAYDSELIKIHQRYGFLGAQPSVQKPEETVTLDLQKAVESAVAKATEGYEAKLTALQADLVKALSAPAAGGPVAMVVNRLSTAATAQRPNLTHDLLSRTDLHPELRQALEASREAAQAAA